MQFLKYFHLLLTWLTLQSLQGVLVALNTFSLLLWRQEQAGSPEPPARSLGEEEEVNAAARWELSGCVCHQGMPLPNAAFNSGMRCTLLLTPLPTFYRLPYLISPWASHPHSSAFMFPNCQSPCDDSQGSEPTIRLYESSYFFIHGLLV